MIIEIWAFFKTPIRRRRYVKQLSFLIFLWVKISANQFLKKGFRWNLLQRDKGKLQIDFEYKEVMVISYISM